MNAKRELARNNLIQPIFEQKTGGFQFRAKSETRREASDEQESEAQEDQRHLRFQLREIIPHVILQAERDVALLDGLVGSIQVIVVDRLVGD